IRAGDIIVNEGQIITNEIYEELQLAGLLKQQQNVKPTIGLALFILILMSGIVSELLRLYNQNRWSFANTIILLIVSVIVLSIMKILSIFTSQTPFIYMVAPIAVGALLVKVLIVERLSIVIAVVYSLLAMFIFNGQMPGVLNIEAGVYFLLFQLAALFFLRNIQD